MVARLKMGPPPAAGLTLRRQVEISLTTADVIVYRVSKIFLAT